MTNYIVEQLDHVALSAGSPLAGMDLMSPFVWPESGRYHIMVRGVPKVPSPDAATGVIASGTSDDGLSFAMDAKLAITPGPQPADAGGCEDPTVLLCETGGYLVYYTGVDAAHDHGSMILAEGPDLASLVRKTLVLEAPPGEGSMKEATLAKTANGEWRLFYEYAANQASRIGMAGSPHPGGPWTVMADPFDIRNESWDDWHLSTGPMTCVPGQDPVMFYNGATRDARWRIGWISFDPDFTCVTGRGIEPLVMPPPPTDRTKTDIAFAASTVIEGDRIALYYSLEDRMLRRALVRRYTG